MNGATVIGNVPPNNVPTIAPPASLLSYNISLNFSSIFAMLPASRLLARLRRVPFGTLLDASEPPTASMTEGWANTYDPTQSTAVPLPAELDQFPAFPGPWGFFTSWYMLGLFIMAVLLHRLQNLIIPSRLPARRSRHAYRFGPTFTTPLHHRILWRRIYTSILPLNFGGTTTRLVLHLPSTYFLCKMLLTWFLLVLQTSEIFPTFNDERKAMWWGILGSVDSLGKWCRQKEMSEICWDTFCAVCAAFLVEGFIKALDGLGRGFPIVNVNPNTSPFNLVGYAFLLHVYSSPKAHAYKPTDGFPSRPDKHVLITISIPLLQLTIFHILSISKRLSIHRLLPTALTSMLSLAHFHGTLFYHLFFKSSLTSPSSTVITSQRLSPYLGRSVNYPLLNYIPNIFETLLICIISLTIFLNVLVQLLVRGRVDRVLSGLGVGQGTMLHDDDEPEPGFFQSLPFEEDFGVLLLRVGIASLEATGLRGWGNEVAPINLPLRTRKRVGSGRDAGDGPDAQSSYGVVRMGRTGVDKVRSGRTYASSSTFAGVSPSFSSRMAETSRRREAATSSTSNRGFGNEVRTVDLGNSETGEHARGRWWSWIREVAAFFGAVWAVLKGLVVFLVERAKGRVRMRESVRKGGGRAGHSQERSGLVEDATSQTREGEQEEESEEEIQRRKEREIYHRFLRGEDISDDEDDEALVSSDEDEESELDGGEEYEEREAEAVGLFTDLLRNSGSRLASTSTSTALAAPTNGNGSGEMVLARLLHGGNGASPLTRRRWNALFNQDANALARRESPSVWDNEDDSDLWGIAAPVPRTIFDGEEHEQRGVQSTCVICTTEARDIICWPCRCLAMCDNCREALASKSTPSKHRCPCCRQTVEGYSRIYIP